VTVGVLYVCYLPIDEPLVQTQVVPYLRGLAEAGHRIHLLTFDTGEPDTGLRTALRDQGIWWHHARYHRRPRLAATAFDVVAGLVIATALCHRYRLDVVHARSHVPAAIGLVLQTMLRRRLIFDPRGLLAEEYVDAGVWESRSAGYRITQALERVARRRADRVIVLTERIRRQWVDELPGEHVVTIPCCADVEAITALQDRRAKLRDALAIGDRPLLLYMGKFGGSCMERETVEFYLAAREALDDPFFLVLTQSDHDSITRRFVRADVDADDFRVMRVRPQDVGEALAAADLGIALIRRGRGTIAASPTKVGEYLAGGLPVVVTSGIGDVDDLVRDSRTGVIVEDTSEAGLLRAAREAAALLHDPTTPARCRRVAEDRLSLRAVGIPRYRELYESLDADV
jgi:glycosyltransferase involved in cell wall biosynthesis